MITFESIFSKKNIARAMDYMKVKKNGGGTDELPLDEFERYWKLNSESIIETAREGKYTPDIVYEYEIINSKGKKRKVSKFTDIDRFIQRLISQKLSDFYSKSFLPNNCAYQEGKGIQTAIELVKNYVEIGNTVLVEIDIEHYFDEINIDKVIDILSEETKDIKVINLINTYLHAMINSESGINPKSKGLIQGSSMSPVLSNIYLQSLDIYLDEMKYNWVRFCDDIFILVDNKENGAAIFDAIKEKLNQEYDLNTNINKSGVYDVFERRILGFDISKVGKRVKVEKHIYKRNAYYRNWNQVSIERINHEYHLVQDGILNKKDYAILFENEDEKHHIPVESTEQINIYNEVTISSAVISRILIETHLNIEMTDQFTSVIKVRRYLFWLSMKKCAIR